MLIAIRGGNPVLPEGNLFETVAEEVFHRYGRNWKPGTLSVNRQYYRNQILPWFRGFHIADIAAADVQEWFASLHATPVAADRSAPVLSVIMTCAETYGYRPEGSNPCKGIKRYRRRGRERFLSEQEVHRLGVVLKKHEKTFPMHVAIIRLLLLTGCRSKEIVTLQWKEYRERHLHLTDSKTGPRMVWLSSPARQIVEGFPRIAPWIFPSPGTGNSISKCAVGYFWREHPFGCRSAGCPASRSSPHIRQHRRHAGRERPDRRPAAWPQRSWHDPQVHASCRRKGR